MTDNATPDVGTISGFTIDWAFAAPPERVFRAWTEPSQFAAWFGAGSDIPLETVWMEVRPGGSWRLVMHLEEPEHLELLFHGEYRAVVEPSRLVLTLLNPFNAADSREETVAVEFTATAAGGTAMAFEQTGHLGTDEYVRTEAGWVTFFEHLEALLGGG